jgi:hypothetical protein
MGSVVYFLYAGKELLYIGQSRNFGRRVRLHRQRFCDEAVLVGNPEMENIWFKGFSVPAEMLDEVELFYIQKYWPPYNVNGMPEALIKANAVVRLAKMELALAKSELNSVKHKLSHDVANDKCYHTKSFWEIDGVKKPALEWCSEYKIGYGQVQRRLSHGLSVKQALTFPRVPDGWKKRPVEYWTKCGCFAE